MKLRKMLLAMALIFCTLLLTSCLSFPGVITSPEYDAGYKLGYYPNGRKFPNTEWHSQEIDMTLYISEMGDFTGTYKDSNGITWTITSISFRMEYMFMQLFKAESITSSSVKEGFLHTDLVAFSINFKYIYKNDVITCDVIHCGFDDDVIPEQLTFKKTRDIPIVPTLRLYAQELDMYIDWNPSIDGIMTGEIVVDGETCHVFCKKQSKENVYLIDIRQPRSHSYTWVGIFEFDGFPNAKITLNDMDIYTNQINFYYPSDINPVITFTLEKPQ